MELHTIGIDLGKTVFHLVGLNLRGKVVVRKKFSRKQLLHFTANLQVELIGMEACGGAHFLGRALREQGHEVRLMPAQYVKPCVKTNKSDYIDAEAIAEAVGRPKMRFVPIKSDDQLDLQSRHRVHERWVMRRTAVINQIRGLLLERGITLRKGRCYEIANQQQPEVHAWRQARPSHDFRIEWLTLIFDEHHRSSARPAADSIPCRMGDWWPSENSSSPPRFPAAARGRVFPWTCAKCSTRDRDQSCRSVHANGRVSCQSRSRSRPL